MIEALVDFMGQRLFGPDRLRLLRLDLSQVIAGSWDEHDRELGDTRRFCSSPGAVRYAGLDITVHQSDKRRAPGHLSRQGPPALRWALFEAAQCARRPGSPDRAYYTEAAERRGGNRACRAVARKLLQHSYHTLRELGREGPGPVA